MAKQADAPGLGPGPREGVGVQIPPLAPCLTSAFIVNARFADADGRASAVTIDAYGTRTMATIGALMLMEPVDPKERASPNGKTAP